MNDNKKLSKLLLRKTTTSFRIAIIFFIFSMLLVVCGSVFLAKQYADIQNEFVDNSNTRTIHVTMSSGSENNVNSLKFSDKKILSSLLKEKYGSGCKIYTMYTIGCGLYDDYNESYFVKGIDQNAAKELGIDSFENNTAYMLDNSKDNIFMNVPVVKITEDGFQSADIEKLSMDIKKMPNTVNPFVLYTGERTDNVMYVGENVFKQIVELLFAVEWEEFVNEYDNNNPYGMTIIDSYLIKMENLSEVEEAAHFIEDSGYCVDYTIKAFNDISATVWYVMYIALFLVCIIVLVSTVTIVLSFRSYYKMQQKDMGILKQMGYSTDTIMKVYLYGVNNTFYKLLVSIDAFAIIISLIIITTKNLTYIIIIEALITIVILFTWLVIRSMLKKYAEKDILYLLKLSKDTE